ncbi:MAG: hypothetical protein AAB393_08145, partial [Bacteroidota bacterium]
FGQGQAFTPQGTVFNPGATDQSSFIARIIITGPEPSTTEIYNQTTTASADAGAFPVAVTFPGTTTAGPGTYQFRLRTELPGDENPLNDELVGSFTVFAPVVGGTYSVGTGQPSPFNTLEGAIKRLKTAGISGPVILELTDANVTLNSELLFTDIPGSSATNTVTIKPATALPPGAPSGRVSSVAAAGVTITGSVSGALIKFINAKNVIFDGSASGGTDRSLSITNSNTGSPIAGFWLSSTGAGGGCQKIVIKNCNITCNADQSTGINSSFGIIGAGTNLNTFSDGIDNDNNTFMNNAIVKVRHGIYLRGSNTNPNDNNVISKNVIGPTSFGSDEIGKA